MIIKKKVAALCKKQKTLCLATAADSTQWIGQGSAFYSMSGLPKMTVSEAMNAFDYTKEEQGKFTTAAVTELGDIVNDDYCDEILVEDTPKRVYYGGAEFMMYNAGGRVILINREYLAPLKYSGETRCYIRFGHSSKNLFLCIKSGFIAEAVIADRKFAQCEIDGLISHMKKIEEEILDGYVPVGGEVDEDEEQIRMEEVDG